MPDHDLLPRKLAPAPDLTELTLAVAALRRDRALLEAIHHAQTQFIIAEDPLAIFGEFLKSLITLTDSTYGFIDEMFYTAEGQPYLTARAITDVSWSDESRKMYSQFVNGTLTFTNLQSLYGEVMKSGKAVIANDAPRDPRRAGIPSGHPPLQAFLGLPLLSNSKEFVGVIGLANRPGGYNEEVVTYLQPMVVACANLIAARKNDQRRQQAEQDLRLAREELELRVQKRTLELAQVNEALRTENNHRQEAVLALAQLAKELKAQRRTALNMAQDADDAKEATKISERRLNLVIDSAQMGAWELDLVNDRAWRSLRHDQIFGYKELLPEWGYEIFLRHVVVEDRDQVKEHLTEAMASGNFKVECRIRWPDQSLHWIAAEGRVHRNDQGKPIRMMGVVMNIDGRKQLEQTMAQQAAELARSNAELELFASVASHDLQEPLRMVSSYVDLLGQRYQGKLDDKADRWIAYAVEGAGRMKRLINDLLDFSRVSTRGKPFAPTDAAAVFNEVVKNLQQAIQDSGARVTCGPLPRVDVDATQLGQLLQNLIGNGIKFRGTQRPEIRVDAERKAGFWWFAVRDNGIGLDAQFAQRIFVIFQRLHTREEYPGTGIGLALCKKIVERHGGRIWVESQPGQGSTFYFTLPDRKDGEHASP